MSADPVILDADGVGHKSDREFALHFRHAGPGAKPLFASAETACGKTIETSLRHPISRLTCPDCIRIHRERAATEGADHE